MSVQRIDHESKTARIELSVVPSTKETLRLAAQLAGCNMNEYVSSAALEAANKTIEALLPLELSKRDFETASRLVDAPRTPNAALIEAAKRYRAKTGR